MELQVTHEICRQIAGESEGQRQRLEGLLEKVAQNMTGIEVSPAQQYALGRCLFHYLEEPGQDKNIERLLALDANTLLDEAVFWEKAPECELKLRQLSQEVFRCARITYSQALIKEIEKELELQDVDEDEETLPADPQAYREECLRRLEQIEKEFSLRSDPYVNWEDYPVRMEEEKSEVLLDLDTICGENRVISLRLSRELLRYQPQASLPKDSGQWFSRSLNPRTWK